MKPPIILVSGATKTLPKYAKSGYFGKLLTPSFGNVELAKESGLIFGIDNEAFGGWDKKKELAFSRLVGNVCKASPLEKLKFICCPDVVCDAAATAKEFVRWAGILNACKLPTAIVIQNGIDDIGIPWDEISAIFIGGDDKFKMSRVIDEIMDDARHRGKWRHVGRVNTFKRYKHFAEIEADSVDGSGFSRWPDSSMSRGRSWALRLENCATLF